MKQAEFTLIPVHLSSQSGQNTFVGYLKDDSGKEWLRVKFASIPEGRKANKDTWQAIAQRMEIPTFKPLYMSDDTLRYKKIRKD